MRTEDMKKTEERGNGSAPDAVVELTKESILLLSRTGNICAAQEKKARRILQRLTAQNLSIAVIGQFKRGKSRLSNTLLGAELMPVGIVPVTSAITRVVYGKPRVEIRLQNGVVETVEPAALSAYISEQENPDNAKGVREAVIHTPSVFLSHGLEYIDTPGVGSYHQNNTEVAYEHMKESDAVIFLLSVDSPINQIEIDFLRNTRNFAGRFYFAVNKIDLVSKEELEEYMTYCRDLLQTLTGEEVKLYPVSAKTGEGMDALKEAILSDSETALGVIVRESARKKMADIIGDAIKQIRFAGKVMNMEYAELDAKFTALQAFIRTLRQDAREKEGSFALHCNEAALALSRKVEELFGMEYIFTIEDIIPGITKMEREDYLARVDRITEEIADSLKSTLLYREENALTVVRKSEQIANSARRLRAIRVILKSL